MTAGSLHQGRPFRHALHCRPLVGAEDEPEATGHRGVARGPIGLGFGRTPRRPVIPGHAIAGEQRRLVIPLRLAQIVERRAVKRLTDEALRDRPRRRLAQPW